jgi:nicotinamide mononucleotide transporter
MDLQQIIGTFLTGIRQTTPLEYIAVFAGIASVWLSRAENIWLYPIGLINTIIYIYLSFQGHLLGEASVNIYYTAMSIWGWWLWAQKKRNAQTEEPVLHITFSTRREWLYQLAFFAVFYAAIFAALTYLKETFAPGAIPWADAFASASAYTGMWLMARKKVESWWWWIITDFASIPLYFVKGYVFSSFQFLVFTVLAILGLISWWQKAQAQSKNAAVL